jgi:hypothetical protein
MSNGKTTLPHETKPRFGTARRFALTLGFVALLGTTAPAQACEDPVTSTTQMNLLLLNVYKDLQLYIQQEEAMMDEKLSNEATYEVINRFYQFDYNIRKGMSALWQNKWLPAMMDMTKQLSAVHIDQARVLASFGDAEQVNENISLKYKNMAESARRYKPNELTCQVDTMMRQSGTSCASGTGCGPTKAYRMSRAIAGAYATEQLKRRGNYRKSPSEFGTAQEQMVRWQDYVTNWCDPSTGDQGCAGNGSTPGTMPGKNIDLAGLLWGDVQTIDMSVKTNRQIVMATQEYLINPLSPDPVDPGAVSTPAGQAELLRRRAMDVRYNTVFNVLSQMLGERFSGSGIDTSKMRLAAGLPTKEATVPPVAGGAGGGSVGGASYRELQESLLRDRFHDPEYISHMINSPEEVVREQGAINALKSEQMLDLYHRQEEMVFMEAAAYATELDHQMPSNAAKEAPLR